MYYPVLIDLNKFKSLVIGGGKVATRKVRNLIEFGNFPVIISPELCNELSTIISSENLEYRQKRYERGDLIGFNLIFSATGDKQSDLIIEKDCMELGILLNVADVPQFCSFILPATIKKSDITISVSSQGTAPFFAKYLKENIEKQLSPNFEKISALATYFRTKLIDNANSDNSKPQDNLIKMFLEIDWEKLFIEKTKIEVYEIADDLFK
jgi:precorrin-2 dehydrogenase / sirohydrochlorin ferrochelatase